MRGRWPWGYGSVLSIIIITVNEKRNKIAIKGIEHHPPGLEDEGVTTKPRICGLSCMQYQADARTVYEECTCNKMADLMFCG